jgi:hypothetical protein
MKAQHHVIALALILAALIQGPVHAADKQLEIVDDQSLASLTGGFCIFDMCESNPSGVCQPFAPTTQALCATVRCTFTSDMVGNTDVFGCLFSGKTTCSNNASYHQCIQVNYVHICTNSDSTTCGDNVEPLCEPNSKERACVCSAKDDGTACDWTDCNQ